MEQKNKLRLHFINGKNVRFCKEKYKKLIDGKINENKHFRSRNDVYRDMAQKIENMNLKDNYIDSYIDRYKHWCSGKTASPNSEEEIKKLATYFDVEIEEILEEVKVEGEEKNMNNVIEKRENEIKKFNDIQKETFLKIMNLILDYIYSYYSNYMVNTDTYQHMEESYYYNSHIDMEGRWMERILKSQKKVIDIPNCFDDKEHVLISEAIKVEDKYYELQEKKFKNNLTKEELNFIEKYRKGIDLLVQQKMIKKYGDMALIRQEIDKTISIFPEEVYKKLLNIVYKIPTKSSVEEYDITDAIEMPNIDFNDINNAIDVDEFENIVLDSTKKIEKNEALYNFVYSPINAVLCIHKIFNDIMKLYFE